MSWDIGVRGRDLRTWAAARARRGISSYQFDTEDELLHTLDRLAGPGRPLDEAARRRMESLLGHELGDVRVHDSRQAAELARRLGGEAFTARNHIFGPSEKLNVVTPEGAGLMAHEITHTIQQTQPRFSAASDWQTGILVPHMNQPMLRHDNGVSQAAVPKTRRRDGIHFERPEQSGLVSASSPRRSVRAGGRPVRGVRGGRIQLAREAKAELSEQVAKSALQAERGVTKQASATPNQPDLVELAEKVYRLMRRDLLLERERGVALG
jgi:hypothetical protein